MKKGKKLLIVIALVLLYALCCGAVSTGLGLVEKYLGAPGLIVFVLIMLGFLVWFCMTRITITCTKPEEEEGEEK